MMRAGQDYGVRVLTAYEDKRVGQIIFPRGALRQKLVKARLVEPVTADPRLGKILAR